MKYRTLILATLFLICSSHAFAWESLPGGGSDIVSYNTNSTGERIVLNLKYSGFWISQDSGNNWEPINSTVYSDEPGYVHGWSDNSIDFLDAAGDSIIVNSGGNYAYSVDGGESWNRFNYPDLNVRTFRFNQNNPSHLYCSTFEPIPGVGSESYFYQSFDFGATWEQTEFSTNSGEIGMVYDIEVSPHNSEIFYASGTAWRYHLNGIYMSVDNGSLWTAHFELQNFITDEHVNQLAFTDILPLSNSDILAFIGYASYDTFPHPPWRENRIFISEDSLQTLSFEDVGLPDNYHVYDSMEIPGFPGHILVNERSGIESRTAYLCTDYGRSFSPISTPLDDQHIAINGFSVNTHTNTIYLCTSGYGVLQSVDGGLNWEQMDVMEDFASLSTFYVSENYISTRLFGGRVAKFYTFSDDSWTTINTNTHSDSITRMNPFTELSDGSLFTNSSSYDLDRETLSYMTSISYDNAENWINTYIEYSTVDRRYVHRYFGDSISRLISIGYDEIGVPVHSVSLDTGRTWNTYEAPIYFPWGPLSQTESYVYSLSVAYEDIYRSSDNCESWDGLSFPDPASLNDYPLLAIENSENLYAFSRDNSYFYDGTWHSGGAVEIKKACLVPVEDSDPILIGFTRENIIQISYDNGMTWEWEGDQLPYHDQIFWLADIQYDQWRDRVWISTPNGMIYKNVSDLSSVDDNESGIPEEFVVLKAYPNPFNNTTQITYRLKNPSNIKLKLYNIEGREVMDLFDGKKSAGEHTLSVNSSTLATGIYFLKLNSGSETFVRKLTLLK